MKYYNREKKIWEDKIIDTGKSLKKRDLCIGKIPHDFILVLPKWKIHESTPDDLPLKYIEKYYELKEYLLDEENRVNKQLEELGINCRKYYVFDNKISKYYKCSKCGKELID